MFNRSVIGNALLPVAKNRLIWQPSYD